MARTALMTAEEASRILPPFCTDIERVLATGRLLLEGLGFAPPPTD